jgi:WD40 repeat protein
MRDGSLRVYSYASGNIKMTYRKKISKTSEWIEDLKFSPDGNYLAVGCHDNKIYMFDTTSMKMKKFGKSSSFIQHIDWNQAGDAIRTNDASYELLFYTIPDGIQNTSGGSSYKNEPWATQSCTLTWPTQGIWQPGQDGTDINHADRSHAPVIDGMQLLATADDSGKLNVYRYPCPTEGSEALKCDGHSSHVTKCRWSPKDNYIFTLGGNDTTVMQWKVQK